MTLSRLSRIAIRPCVLTVLCLLVVVGFFFRFDYLRTISLHVDEFISLLAIRSIVQHGYPLLPSGTLYEQGLLFSYLEALLLRVVGFDATGGRLFSLVLSLATIFLVYFVGSRLFSSQVGLVATALTALSADSIAWGARVRMYALLQLLVLLAVWFLWRGGAQRDGGRYRWLAILCYLGALFTHPVSVLLFLPFLLGLILLRGPRAVLELRAIPEVVVPLGGILATLLLKAFGQPGQLEALAESRPYLAPSLNVVQNFRPIAPFFLSPQRTPLTVLAVLGLVAVCALVVRNRSAAAAGSGRWEPAAPAFVYTILVVTVLEMVFLVGPTWRDSRYLFMVEPFLFLCVSWVAVLTARWVTTRLMSRGRVKPWRRFNAQQVSWLLAGLLVVGACVLSVPSAHAVVSQQEWGYDLAFEYLADQWEEGDTVLTIVPFACELYLPQCDYYASVRAYEEYVFERDGVLVDRWIGAPLLRSAAELESVLQKSPRTWFVVDGWRLAARFDLDFIETVVEQMDVVHEVQGVRVLLAEGYSSVAVPEIDRPVLATFGDHIQLVRYELSKDALLPGDEVLLTLHWRALQPIGEEYTVFAHLRGRDGALIAQDDYPPLENLYPTYYWSEGEDVPDPRTLRMPTETTPGLYRLEVGLYGSGDGQPLLVDGLGASPDGGFVVLDYLLVGVERDLVPSHNLGANLGDQVLLVGLDGVPRSVDPGQDVHLSIYWQALADLDQDYTVFVHMVDHVGRTVAQYDDQPSQGFYPTSFWDVGETVRDELDLAVGPQVPFGEYELVAGMYLLSTGERLPVLEKDGRVVGDLVNLGSVVVGH